MVRERDRLVQQLREQSDRVEAERFEELDVHRNEVRNLRTCIESLQKEISDRQVGFYFSQCTGNRVVLGSSSDSRIFFYNCTTYIPLKKPMVSNLIYYSLNLTP